MNKLLFVTILSSGAFFSFNILLAKVLGAEVYGKIQYYTSFMQIFILSISINYGSLYMGSKILKNNHSTFGLFISVQTLLFLLMVFPAYLLLNLFSDNKTINILILTLSYILVLQNSAGLEYNSRREIISAVWVGSAASRLILIVIFSLLILGGYGSTKLYFISYLISVLLIIIYAFNRLKPKLHINYSIFSRAWKFYLLGIIGSSFIYIAQVLQKEYYDYSQLASLALVLLIMNGLDMWSSLLLQIILPIAHKAWKNNDLEKISNIYKESTYAELIVFIPIFLFVLFHIDEISYALGVSYYQLPMFFYILSVGYFIEHITGISGTLLRVTENEHFELLNEVVRLIVGLLLIIALNSYEYGIAIAITISTITYSILKFSELYYLFRVWPLNRSFFKKIIMLVLCIILFFYFSSLIKNIYIELLSALSFLTIGYYYIYNIIIKKIELTSNIS